MEFDKKDIAVLKSVQDSYMILHSELNQLEKELEIIEKKKKIVSEKLNTLRLNEAGLINKIEEANDIKLTNDYLIKLLNDEN